MIIGNGGKKMSFKYDKDTLKENLTIEEVFDLVSELGGEPILDNNFFNLLSNNPFKNYLDIDETKIFVIPIKNCKPIKVIFE